MVSDMDASSTSSDSANDQGKALVATSSATSLPNSHDGNGPVQSPVRTLNGSQTMMNSHSSGGSAAAAGRLAGTTVPCVRSDSSGASMAAVTSAAVNSATAGLSKPGLAGAMMPPLPPTMIMTPTMSNSVIQTPFMNSLGVTSSPQPPPAAASHTAAGAHAAVTQLRPSMQTAGSGIITLNGNNNNAGGTHLAANAAPQPAAAGIPTQLTSNNGQPSTAALSVSAGSNIMKAEAPKAIVQHTLGPQQQHHHQANAPGVVSSPIRTAAPATVAAAAAAGSPGGNSRPLAPQMLAPRPPMQTSPGQPNVHNLQLPPGMVLVRSESGQLLMIHHQALAQMQAQAQQGAMAPRPGTPTNMPAGQTPGTPSIISRQVAPSTIIRQTAPPPTHPPISATTTLHRPPVLQTSTGAALPGMTSRTVTQTAGTTVTSATVSNETMENVKKCKNFLSTLIKLASSGRQSSETAANVRGLVKDLLESKLEAEDFTSRLYSELNSSPQPYLVPFLKRSLPAVRQLTPDYAAFIQQSQLPQLASGPASATPSTPTPRPSTPSTPPATTTTTVVLSSTAGPRLTAPITRPQLPQLQPAISKPGQTQAPLVFQPQQQGAIRRPQVTVATTPMVTLRNQAPGRIMLGQPQVLNSVPMVRPGFVPATKQVPATALSLAQRNKLKEAGGTFKDDDDINDVASMAGVNLSEESARILATNSELVGAVTRSCKDEAFLGSSMLHRRMLDIGKRFGVTELDGEVVTYVSHATQQRLRNLLEKVSQVAQQKNVNFKEEGCYEQSSDVRAELKFFEQLDQLEKQRKEEQEREILLKAAKSRARQEDPEQLRLKQKAKEMQQQELAQIRQKEANQTALAAIGPRKKRKMGSGSSAAGAEGSGSSPSASGGAGPSGSRPTRQRITRVNLRDLLFCLENERFTGRSHFLYKGFLK